MFRLRLPRLCREQPLVEPNQPHRFRQIHDSGLAAMAGRGPLTDRGYSAPTQLLVTNNYLRASRCGVPGCGRPREQAIHELADE